MRATVSRRFRACNMGYQVLNAVAGGMIAGTVVQ